MYTYVIPASPLAALRSVVHILGKEGGGNTTHTDHPCQEESSESWYHDWHPQSHVMLCHLHPHHFDFHVRESLVLLEYQNVLETTNMFFLQELDIGLNPCLTRVQEMDDAHVLAIMGLHAKAQQDRAITSYNPRINDGFDQTAMFPIGPNPTWTKFKQAIADNPMIMMKKWTFASRFNHFGLVAAKLFCTFTTQIWMMVAKETLKGIVSTPTSLSDFMRCWTIISVDDMLTGTMFEACNVGPDNAEHTSHGHQGPRSRSFFDQMEIFFPSSESPPRKDSQWSRYWDGKGYIKKYHDILYYRNQEEKAHLNEALLSIFSELQCLLASQKITQKIKGFVWKCKSGSFVFVTNPKFYKIESLSKEFKQARTTKGKVHRPSPCASKDQVQEGVC